VKIPAKNTFEEGAMLEPVNTVLKAVKRLALLPCDNVLVAGQGPIGLMFTKLLQLRGMNVLATDLLESRLRLAKKFGAKWTSNVGQASSLPYTKTRKASNNRGSSQNTRPPTLDAAVLAVPSDAALKDAFEMVRGAGQILLFAHTKRGAMTEVDLASVCVDEKDLLGSYSADFTLQKEVARIVFSRQLDVRGLITHRFPLEKAAEAVDLASHPTPDSLKVIVTDVLSGANDRDALNFGLFSQFFTLFELLVLGILTVSQKRSKKIQKSIDRKLALWDSPFTHGNK